jgi:ribonuclease P protein component
LSDSKPYSLGKTERLKSRKQIDQVFENGKKISLFPFRLLYLAAQQGGPGIRAGFTVSSKTFPRAVDRNRIKRLCREAYRLQKKELETVVQKNDYSLHLFFIYTGREMTGYEGISVPVKKLLDKLAKVIYEKDTPNT